MNKYASLYEVYFVCEEATKGDAITSKGCHLINFTRVYTCILHKDFIYIYSTHFL